MRLNYIKDYKMVIIVSAILLFAICGVNTEYRWYGDGPEYWLMITSFINHGTFAFNESEIKLANEILNLDIGNLGYALVDDRIRGYFLADNGLRYCYHFWFYSLLGCIPYIVVKSLGLKLASVFFVYNAGLIVVLLWYILYKMNLTDKSKIALAVFSVINPVLLYVPWTHPEVFIYVFFLLGIFCLYERKIICGTLCIVIASYQGTVLAMIPFFIFMYALLKKYDKAIVLKLGICCLITLLPSAFYYYHFGTFSLISKSGAANIAFISLEKIWSLLFDLNFGYIAYVPIILGIFFYSCFIKKYPWAIAALIVFLLTALGTSVQKNWNPGMMYIHRYCIWLLPLLILGIMDFLLNNKHKKKIIAIYLATGLIFLGAPLYRYNVFDYLDFHPLARSVIMTCPSIYNPEKETFIERSLRMEGGYEGIIQIEDADGKIRKIMRCYDGVAKYENGEVDFSLNNLLGRNMKIKLFTKNILLNNRIAGLYSYEKNIGRWLSKNEVEVEFMIEEGQYLKLVASDKLNDKNVKIFLNDESSWQGIIGKDPQKIELRDYLKQGVNKMKIVVNNPPDIPAEMGINNDTRKLFLLINELSVEDEVEAALKE